MPNETYTSRLGCSNCGHAAAYHLPCKALITSYDFDDRTPSSFRLVDRTTEHLIDCENCKLPHLIVLWWKEEEVEAINGK